VRPRLFLLLLLPALLPSALPAEDHWIALKSGPFEVYSAVGERPAREKLMYLEQFRETLRVITGKAEMRLVWPVRVLIFKSAAEIPAAPKQWKLGRDARMAAFTESGEFSRDSLKELARLLLYENTNRLPPSVEQGLIALVSTVQIDGPKITLGAPVPEAERSPGWALMQLVTVNPEYAGRTRVMISNLEQSVDFEAACHNAFEKSAAQIQQQADANLKSGNFATASISGRALSMTRDFKPVQLGAEDVRIAQADLLLASGHVPEAAAAYKALHGPEASEGIALMELDDQKDKEARAALQDAIDSHSKSARAWLELGRMGSDEDQLKKASELNPRWAEPYFQLAELNPAIDKANLEQRATLLKKAANLDPRNSEYWTALAKTDIAAKDFAEAQKAWAGAERAAANDEDRERIHKIRSQVEEKRFDYEAAERKRIKDEAEADLQRVKAQSEAEIHAAEAAARKKMNPNGAVPPKPEALYEEPAAGVSVEGLIQRLDCLDQRARLVIQTPDGKTMQLLMADPSQITLGGGGEKTFSCGAQKQARSATIHYNAKPDAKLHTEGVVIAIEFH
jgi:cytochrome c-type biogenesis protein CcmH/NrfG